MNPSLCDERNKINIIRALYTPECGFSLLFVCVFKTHRYVSKRENDT